MHVFPGYITFVSLLCLLAVIPILLLESKPFEVKYSFVIQSLTMLVAYNAFTTAQKEVMLKHVDEIVHSPIPTIERIGGGSVRCMMAEIL